MAFSSSSFESENLTAEKIDAMKRFERRRKLWRFLPVVEAVVAVLVLFSWLTPPLSAVDVAGEYLRRLSGGLNRGVFVFAVVNVLVAVIFYLSDLQKQIEPDLYGQYVSSVSSAAVSRSTATDVGADTFGDKQETDVHVNAVTPRKSTEITGSVSSVREQTNGAVKSDGGALTAAESTARVRRSEMTVLPPAVKRDGAVKSDGGGPTAKREMVRAVSSVAGRRQMTVWPLAVERDGAVKSDGGALTARREMVRATSSVAGRREMTVLPLTAEAQIYRRSTSERLDRRRISRRRCDIDDLSSEEFRTTVETFIAGKKKMLLRETFDV